MASGYLLSPDESPFAALRRIVAEQMEATATSLRDRGTGVAGRVHESRKRFKETRALLRLFREALGTEFRTENLWYRDAGRELGDYRDADAVVAAVDSLSPKIRQRLGYRAMRKLRRVVRNEHRAAYQDTETVEGRIETIAAQLPIAAARLDNIPSPERHGFAAIEQGLVRTLRDGKRAMREACESGHAVAFHEWRKRVKDHWYQVQLLKPVWPGELDKRERLLDKLSHILGEHHDLEVIRSIVVAAENAFTADEATHIDRTLATRQRRLERRAKPIGDAIYGMGAKVFARRVGKRWSRWRPPLDPVPAGYSDSPSFRRIRGDKSHSRSAVLSGRNRTP